MTDANDLDANRGLLGAVAVLYERARAERPQTAFNVFAALRSASDEVDLHSRFLHAVLGHVDPVSGKQDNLEEFLRQVADVKDFKLDGARVEREMDRIDLLVSNGRQAVVIENKIWALDQDRQLERYRDALVRRGYKCSAIRLLYLTLDGHEPDSKSLGRIPLARVDRVSYRDDLPGWLIGCQRRAFGEPGLREALGQYIQLIGKMTGSDHEGRFMDELTAHLLRDNNLAAAGRIARALVDAEATAVARFYRVVDGVLREVIEDLPEVDPAWAYLTEESHVRKAISGFRKSDTGLYYPIREGAWLYVGGDNRLQSAVYCLAADHPGVHAHLSGALGTVGGGANYDWAPWHQWLDESRAWGAPGEWLHIREPNDATLEFLGSEDSQEALARALVKRLRELWLSSKDDL